MITYKGDRLVKGKRFMEGTSRVLTYKGKIFGDHYLFDDRGIDIILNEYEVSKLEDYQILKEHSLIEEQEDSNDLYQLVTSYTDEQIKIINGPSKNMWTDLPDSFQKELNDFNDIPLEFRVEDYTVENTGGGTMVAMGKLKDNNYFGLSSEFLAIFDEDYHKAYLAEEDITEWEEEHRINYFDYYDEEYNIVASQVKGFEVEDEE